MAAIVGGCAIVASSRSGHRTPGTRPRRLRSSARSTTSGNTGAATGFTDNFVSALATDPTTPPEPTGIIVGNALFGLTDMMLTRTDMNSRGWRGFPDK